MRKITVLLGLGFCAATVFADLPVFTGQCPSINEIQVQKGPVTINGKVYQMYQYSAMTDHNGAKMFLSFKAKPTLIPVGGFSAAIINPVNISSTVSPVECVYKLQDGEPLLLFSMDPVGIFQKLTPAQGDWSGDVCNGGSAGDCQWHNKIGFNPPISR